MEELISRVIAASGLNDELARKAVGIILAFLQKEGPPAEIGELMAALPGAAELAAADGEHFLRDRLDLPHREAGAGLRSRVATK